MKYGKGNIRIETIFFYSNYDMRKGELQNLWIINML